MSETLRGFWYKCLHVRENGCLSVCVFECASSHTLISQQKNRTQLIREQREQRGEIRNPIQWRALVHCKCSRGHTQFQKEQVLYIRVWIDGRPLCSLSYRAHAKAWPDVINMDLVEIPVQLNTYFQATRTIAVQYVKQDLWLPLPS